MNGIIRRKITVELNLAPSCTKDVQEQIYADTYGTIFNHLLDSGFKMDGFKMGMWREDL
jgi:hypothetical protein